MSDLPYGRQAELYDLIYSSKSYDEEAAKLHDVLIRLGVADGSRVLEAACGTGRYLEHLQSWYQIAGFDISDQMVAIARNRLPGRELFVADMRTFTIDAPVDALLCLFSSIGYLLTDADLEHAIRSFARATKPGGALVIEPWIMPDKWDVGRPSMDLYRGADLQVCRQCVAERDGDVAVMTMHYLVARRNEGVRHLVETHRLRLLPLEALLGQVKEAGYEATVEPEAQGGRGLIVGTKGP